MKEHSLANSSFTGLEIIKERLKKHGNSSLGEWIYNELSSIYETDNYKNRFKVNNRSRVVKATPCDFYEQKKDSDWSFIHNFDNNKWIKRHMTKVPRTKANYIFQPNEMNQRIALSEIFKKFDDDASNTLSLEEFIEMFIQNYISNVYGTHENVDINYFLNHQTRIKNTEKDLSSSRNPSGLDQSQAQANPYSMKDKHNVRKFLVNYEKQFL